ncbi:hypothetical protein [Thalassolituus oleivorans]
MTSASAQPSRIECEIRGHIAYVYLNRPDKLNGLDMAMFHDMVATAKKSA